jgi:hypothetical chaperone protein
MFERFFQVLEQRLGHHLAMIVEQSKIALSLQETAIIKVPELQPNINTSVTRNEFEESIHEDVEKIVSTLKSTISNAQISPTKIDAVFMTGGASLVPLVRKVILSYLPGAQIIEGDKFGSVATGLTHIASRKWA